MTAVADPTMDVVVSRAPLHTTAPRVQPGGSIPYALVGLKVGSGVAKAVMTAAVCSRTPEALGSAIMSATSVRGHVQAELVHLIAVRVSMHAPSQLSWLLQLVTEYCATSSTGSAITTLATRTLRYHVTAFGLRGIMASAIASAAVGALCSTCSLLTSNAAFWRAESAKMSLRQYRYELTTNIYAGVGTVVGSGLGAMVGTVVLPGFGTVFGSVTMSLGGSYLATYWRKGNGPDERRRRYLREAATYEPLQIESFRFTDPETGELMEGSVLVEAGEMKTMSPTVSADSAARPLHEAQGGEEEEEDLYVQTPVGALVCDSAVLLTRKRAAAAVHEARGIDEAEAEVEQAAAGLVTSCLSFRSSPADKAPCPESPETGTNGSRWWQRSILRWRHPGPASAPPAQPIDVDTCQLAGSVTAYETMHSWADVDRAVESCGPEEMVMVFAARHDGAPLAP